MELFLDFRELSFTHYCLRPILGLCASALFLLHILCLGKFLIISAKSFHSDSTSTLCELSMFSHCLLTLRIRHSYVICPNSVWPVIPKNLTTSADVLAGIRNGRRHYNGQECLNVRPEGQFAVRLTFRSSRCILRRHATPWRAFRLCFPGLRRLNLQNVRNSKDKWERWN
jgi:hypothetical protein